MIIPPIKPMNSTPGHIMDRREWYIFLEKNKYLTNFELAQLAGVCVKTIQRWRHKFGIAKDGNGWGCNSPKRPFNYKSPERKIIFRIPKGTLTDEWLCQKYLEGYSVVSLSRMTGRGIVQISYQLRKNGVKLRETPVHKCNNRKWLEEHYEVLRLPAKKCAKIAGVNMYTIYNWLVKYGIPIREVWDAWEQQSIDYATNSKADVPQKVDKTQTA